MAHASALPHFASGSFVSSCSPSSTGASAGRRLALLASLVLVGCSSGGGSVDPSGAVTTTQAELQRVEFGRLVDVYGLQNSASGSTIELFRRDVLIGSNIRDERSSSDNLTDAEITYDFLGADPDSLQPRLFIPRELGSPAFQTAFDALDDQLREVAPMVFGSSGPGNPFGVVPRNAGIRLTFSRPLGIDDSFFVERDANGQVVALRNTEAVQLLQIVGDPTQPNAFKPLPVRVIVNDRTLVLDPVLLGSEGLQYQTVNNPAGLPQSPDQSGANLRIALALEGPLAVPQLRPKASGDLVGLNNSQRSAIVRDFRSANASDTSADMTRGFVRDPLPLRILGEMVMLLEKVENINAQTQEVTVFKNGIVHEIDRGDVLRFVADSSGVPFGSAEVVADPEDDRGQPGVQHVRVRIRRVANLESIDPRNKPGYPSVVSQREPWLVLNAPRAVLVAEFEAGGRIENGVVRGDDPRYFLSFTPTPLPNLDGSQPDLSEFVSPYAGAVVRFTKPVDIATVKWADTFFFAMRDLTNSSSIDQFIASRPNQQGGVGMDPGAFNPAKYRTPYLVTARVYDENGSQTSLRLQPTAGFYLDDTMRNPPAGADYRYFLHLIADSPEGGVRDLAGNRVDLQGDTADRSNSVVIPFTVDTRMNGNQPFFDDNLAISVVRRFASRDEDAQPSYFLGGEIPAPGQAPFANSYPLEDMVGGFVYLDGKLQPRPTTRVRQVVDNLNQAPVGQQNTPLAWCPPTVANEQQISNNTSTTLLNLGLQNPLNPYGCRLQTCWREVDLSLSRTEPFDFNLDIEQMYWAPFTGTNLSYDEFDRVSLFLGHSEHRPMPCVGNFSALPSLPESGLSTVFQRNYVWNPQPTGSGAVIESQPAPVAAYVDQVLRIDPAAVVLESNGVNRFLPLPRFKKPYFVFRDETVVEQGVSQDMQLSDGLFDGSDLGVTGNGAYQPHLLSPFANGLGRRRAELQNGLTFVNSFWNDAPNSNLSATTQRERFTGGLVGNVALPLLADFWTYCDRPDLPAGNGFIADGTNGWQIAIPVQSDPRPYFRAFSAGRVPVGGQTALCRAPGDAAWTTAAGGFAPPGSPTGNPPPRDNTFYWIMLDLLKRQSVITAGFIDINNPHRVPEGFADPRLGPFYLVNGVSTRPANVVPSFAYEFDPPLDQQPAGTSVVPQFRGAGVVDGTPWYWNQWMNTTTPLYPAPDFTAAARQQLKPTPENFPLDPYKAGDAHIRKWDTRPIPGSGTTRNWWTYFYNRTVTRYVDDPNLLMDPNFTIQFKGPNEVFTPNDIRYVNWRLVTSNNTDASPPVSPTIETFAMSYRFQRTN
ncbi:MAG: hypothetical protein JNM25_14705 [Planctomycetes bacterium]|nr:hypothetical protein [Planctomycetota bacterium]